MKPSLTKALFLASALIGVASSAARATAISGSDVIGAGVLGTNEVGGNLGTTSLVTLASTLETFSVLLVGSGEFAGVPVGTTVTLGSSTLDFSNAASFSFTSATVGTFTPSTIIVYGQTSTSINVFLEGAFTPGTDFASGATAPFGASENIGLTQTNGGQISLSGTFASPPAAPPVIGTPEPRSILLLGMGVIGLAGFARKRRLGS